MLKSFKDIFVIIVRENNAIIKNKTIFVITF